MSTARGIVALLTPVERRRAAFLVLLMVIGMGFELVGVGLVLPVVTLLMDGEISSSYPALARFAGATRGVSRTQLVTVSMTALVAIFFVKTAFLAYLSLRQSRFTFEVQASLSQRLFGAYLSKPYAFMLQRNSAQLVRNTLTEVNQFAIYAVTPVLTLATEGLVLAGLAALLFAIEPVGAAVTMLVSGVSAFAFHQLTRQRVAAWGLLRQEHEGLRLQHLQQGLGAAKDVKLLGREAEFLARFRSHNALVSRIGGTQMTVAQLPRLGLEFLAIVSLAVLILTMVGQGQGADRIIPALGVFAVAAYRILPSVNRALTAAQAIRFGHAAVELLVSELKDSEIAQPQPVSAPLPFTERITLTDVAYTYPGATQAAIERVSMTVHRGEAVGIVGPSGSGKTTIVDVLLGLLQPSCGEVAVDGRDIHAQLHSWQRQVGYVAQVIYLTDDTLRRNIAFGVPDGSIDDAAVARAIRAAQLDEFVALLPSGVETIVGERGVRLSGGQRQRVGIARALYHDPAVLVLDEATSSLDGPTERDIMESVTALHRRKTVIIVAHRLSTVEHCDRLYRVDQGHIVSEGKPATVLADWQAEFAASEPPSAIPAQ